MAPVAAAHRGRPCLRASAGTGTGTEGRLTQPSPRRSPRAGGRANCGAQSRVGNLEARKGVVTSISAAVGAVDAGKQGRRVEEQRRGDWGSKKIAVRETS